MAVRNNVIQNIGYADESGGRHVIGHVFEPVSFNAANFTNITIDGNTASNITYTNTKNREFIFVDLPAPASNGNVTITNNNWNMPSAGAQQGIELRFRQTNASTVNVLVNNNGSGSGATSNTAVAFLDIDAEDAAIVRATVTNNGFTNSSATTGQQHRCVHGKTRLLQDHRRRATTSAATP